MLGVSWIWKQRIRSHQTWHCTYHGFIEFLLEILKDPKDKAAGKYDRAALETKIELADHVILCDPEFSTQNEKKLLNHGYDRTSFCKSWAVSDTN